MSRHALALGVAIGLALTLALILADHVTPRDVRPCSIEAPC